MSKARNMARMGQDTSAGYTGAFDMPAGTTAERPASAGLGWTRLNTDTGSVEVYDGTNWNAVTRPFISSVTGTIYAGAASDLVIAGQNFTSTITVRFLEGGSTVADVTGVSVSSGSATVAVPAAVYGQTAGDSIEIKVINSDGTMSANGITKTVIALPTGGTITTSGGYRYHTFNSSSNLVIPSGFTNTVEHLIVAGGGGGGAPGGGGGGAGGAISGSGVLSANTYSITIGGGGSAGVYMSSPGGTGGNSSFNGSTASGGGGGGGNGVNATSGGSGGGIGGAGGSPGSGTSGQGNSGGGGNGNAYGGGGGKNAAGQTGVTSGGNGGAGISWGVGTYAGGGGGGCSTGTTGPGGTGGAGGGGNGSYGDTPSVAGTVNTGGGGGGRGNGTVGGAAGGSGVVIVRYAL